ncbi:hypothetical protein ACIQXW_02385 [Lysinibacillus sp. NPDC097162]|uniref:hypothetical protein n=1 Tax=Lysinibacillus sp. NPDC097162 TaxID=3364140 RepID=UPI0037FB1C6D
MKRNNEISKSKLDIKGGLDTTVFRGIKVMDKLQSEDISEAIFKNGAYLKVTEDYRVIVDKNIMLKETKTDLFIRISKDGSSIDEVLETNYPKTTQKMLASFVGKSQSTVSKTKNSTQQISSSTQS